MNEYWKNWFGWSWSRHNLWIRCPLKYYYSYIGKWEPGLDGEKCKMLTKLTQIKLEKGGIIHDIIRQQLYHHSTGRGVNKDSAKNQFQRKMNELKFNKKSIIEQYNGIKDIHDEDIDNAIEDGLKELDIFFTEIWPNYSDKIYKQHEKFETFLLDEKTVWVVVDYVSTLGDKYIVTDWKTGNPQEIENLEQMKAYALWANQKFEVDYENIITEVAFLQNGEIAGKSFSNDEMEDFKKLILEDCELWWDVHSIDDFEAKPDLGKCKYCNFLTICQHGQGELKKEGSA